MTVAFFSAMAGLAWGGSEELWAAAARAALAAGHRVVISIPRWRPRAAGIQQLKAGGAAIFERPRLRSKTWRQLIDWLTLRHLSFARRQPDVLCISEGGMYDFLRGNHPKVLPRLLGPRHIPYVVVCQYNDERRVTSPDLRERARSFLGAASRVVFVAEGNRRLAERQLARQLPHAIVVSNPAMLTNTAPVPWRDDSTTIRFCCVARLDTEYKGQDVLLEALSFPPWRSRRWELRLYGDGRDRGYLEELAVHFDIRQRVFFGGHVKDIRSVWAENDILALPSHGEGTPLALIEAMLCGRPAVVTDVGGNAEWVQEGKTGFIAPSPTPRHVTAALERAWEAREYWREIGARAREAALAKHDSNPGGTLLRILEEAATGSARVG